MFQSSPGVGLIISPLPKKGERRRKETYTLVFPSFIIFCEVSYSTKNLNKVKLGLTLELVPSEVAISVAPFFGDQGYLISFWLTKLFHDFDLKKI